MAKHSAKRKKALPRLAEATDLGEIFGGVPAAGAIFAEEVEAALAGVDLQTVLAEKRGGIPRPPTHKEILKAYPSPQEELDLHGSTGEEAARRTTAFIQAAIALKLLAVRIITGQGLHSEGAAVLPSVVEGCLAELQQREAIFHYSWGEKGRERSGAVEVFLLAGGKRR